MAPAIRLHIRRARVLAAVIGLTTMLAGPVTVHATDVGGIASNFTLTNRANNQPINLTDFAGKILVLDFFAWWCGPCQASSPVVESDIQKYYAARGGNAYGVPVQVLAVNIESSSPSQTDAFVAAAGLELVGNDTGGAYSQFSLDGIPLFVIINCVASSPNRAQWEVLYKQDGFAGSATLRGVIDAVQAPKTDILTFGFQAMPAPRIVGNKISVTAPAGMDLTTLAPTYTVSSGASGSPASGTVRNFSTPQTYTVTAGTFSKTYTVTVTPFGRYDFNDGTLQGWNNRVWNGSAWIDLAPNAYTYSGTLLPASANNGLFVAGPVVVPTGSTENHLNTLWLRSPRFHLNGSGNLTVDLAQGITKTLTAPANDQSVPYAALSNTGWIGVALRRVSDGVFVLAKPRTGSSGSTYRTVTFTQAELAPFVGSAVYTLDLINTDWGPWGWVSMDNVSIPGSAVGPEGSPRWNVSIDTATRTGLAGPAGGGAEIWNQPLNTAGLSSTSLLDASGAATSVGFTCSAGYVASWGSPGLTLLTGGAYQLDWSTATSLVLSNLIPGRKYDLYLASFHPNDLGGSSVFSTTNTTSTSGSQIANNGGASGNASTWVQGTNYACFQNIVPSSANAITVSMVGNSGTNAKRAYLNGFQLVDVTCAPTTTTLALTAGASPSNIGAALTYTATVAGGAMPTGNVTFYDCGTQIGSTALNGSYQASITLSTLALGTHGIMARYMGNSSNAFSSTAPLSQSVLQSPFSIWASAAAQGLTAGINDGLSMDPDNDGISNLLEFALGGAPMISSRAILPVLSPTKSAGVWEFHYDRSDLSQSSTTQVVEYGSELSGWTAVTIPESTAGIVTITPGSPSDHVRVSIPNPGAKCFVRLKVIAN